MRFNVNVKVRKGNNGDQNNISGINKIKITNKTIFARLVEQDTDMNLH